MVYIYNKIATNLETVAKKVIFLKFYKNGYVHGVTFYIFHIVYGMIETDYCILAKLSDTPITLKFWYLLNFYINLSRLVEIAKRWRFVKDPVWIKSFSSKPLNNVFFKYNL